MFENMLKNNSWILWLRRETFLVENCQKEEKYCVFYVIDIKCLLLFSRTKSPY